MRLGRLRGKVLFAAQAVDSGRVCGEPAIEQLAIGEFRLEVAG